MDCLNQYNVKIIVNPSRKNIEADELRQLYQFASKKLRTWE